MNNSIETSIKTLRLSKKAFQICKSEPKIETLRLAFEQIEPILEQYMKENRILKIDLDLKNKDLLVLEPVHNNERTFWIESWLKGDISSFKLTKMMHERFQWVQYLSFADFLEGIEFWLKEKANMND